MRKIKVETKYDIGDHVWCIFPKSSDVLLEVFDTTIVGIDIDKNGIFYLVDPVNLLDIREENIALYDDKEKLFEIIKRNMEIINKE